MEKALLENENWFDPSAMRSVQNLFEKLHSHFLPLAGRRNSFDFDKNGNLKELWIPF